MKQLERLIVKAKSALSRDMVKVLEKERVGGEHGWRVGLVEYFDRFLNGGAGGWVAIFFSSRRRRDSVLVVVGGEYFGEIRVQSHKLR